VCTPTWECVRIGGDIIHFDNNVYDSESRYNFVYDTESEEEDIFYSKNNDKSIERKNLLSPALTVTSGGLDSKILKLAGEKRARFYANRNFYCCCCYCIPCHSNILVRKLGLVHFEKKMQMNEEILMEKMQS